MSQLNGYGGMFQSLSEGTSRYENRRLQDEQDELESSDVLGGGSNEEIIWQRDPKIVNYNWTKEATRLLIGLRTSLDNEFDDPNQRKMDLWERIAGVLSDHGFEFPPSICDKKWRNLLVSFRRTISRGTQGKINRFPYTWEFYKDLYEYWKKKDPVGFGTFEMAANGGEFEPDASDEIEDNEDQQDLDGQEDVTDGGDMNKFLSVTLSDSEADAEGEDPFVEESGDESEEYRNVEDPMNLNVVKDHKSYANTLPLPPNLTVEPAETPRLLPLRGRTLEPAATATAQFISNRPSPSPQAPRQFQALSNDYQPTSVNHLVTAVQPRELTRRAIPTVTIEEVTPSNLSNSSKRSHYVDSEEVPFQMSSVSSGVGVNIIMREMLEQKESAYMNGGCASFNSKRLRVNNFERDKGNRERELSRENDLKPPSWFRAHMQEAEKWEKLRWEEEKSIRNLECQLRSREVETTRDLHLQKIQAINRLSSALLSFVDSRPGNHRPSTT